MSMSKEIVTYHYRGQIERPSSKVKSGYRWYNGYSETTDFGHISFPWLTKREAMQDAARRGMKAKFIREKE